MQDHFDLLVQLAINLRLTWGIDDRQAFLGVDVQIDDAMLTQGLDLGLVRHQEAGAKEGMICPATIQVMDVHAGAQLGDMDSSDSVSFHIFYK